MASENKSRLRNRLFATLTGIGDLNITVTLSEFWQGELKVLMHLAINRDLEIFPSDLSEATNLSRSRITAVLNNLRKKEYIIMKMPEYDRRRMRVEITKSGEEYVSEKFHRLEAQLDGFITKTGEERILRLIDSLDAVLPYIDEKN